MTYGAKNPLTGMGDGYVKLWSAVMEQAVEDLTLNGFNRNTIRIKHEVIRWFKSSNRGVGTFLWICEALDLDAQCILKGVGRLLNA